MFQLPFEAQASSFIALYLSLCFYQVGCVYPDLIRTARQKYWQFICNLWKPLKRDSSTDMVEFWCFSFSHLKSFSLYFSIWIETNISNKYFLPGLYKFLLISLFSPEDTKCVSSLHRHSIVQRLLVSKCSYFIQRIFTTNVCKLCIKCWSTRDHVKIHKKDNQLSWFVILKNKMNTSKIK